MGSALDIGQVSAAKGQKLKAQSKVENTYEKRCLTQRRKDAKKMTENEIAEIIVDAAFHIHKSLGPGLLESVYEVVLAHGLEKAGLRVKRQVPVPVVFDGIRFDEGFRADLIVEDKVIVELKSVEKIAPVHKKQLLTYRN